MKHSALLALCLFFSLTSLANDFDQAITHDIPRELKGVGLDKTKIGKKIDLDTVFAFDNGEKKPLKEAFLKSKPTVISMVYYNCPGLCNMHMNGAGDMFQDLNLTPGKDYNWVMVSMDHTEDSNLASEKKVNYIDRYPVNGANQGWKMLTGSEASVKKITSDLGFGFKWDEASKQYAHAAALYVLTPKGVISQIIPGIEFDQKTVRLSLVEAANGELGTFLDQFVLFCFQFDPTKNKYTLYAFNLMRIAGLLMVLILGIILTPMWLKEFAKDTRGNES